MNAWVELLRDNPASCLCLLIVAVGGLIGLAKAIRGEGRK